LSARARESFLFVGNESVGCNAFSQLYSLQSGSVLSEPLLAIKAKYLMRIEAESAFGIVRDGAEFDHTIVAKVVVRDAGIVK
jgi:hypothetical protein